jgi:hypothetical protein
MMTAVTDTDTDPPMRLRRSQIERGDLVRSGGVWYVAAGHRSTGLEAFLPGTPATREVVADDGRRFTVHNGPVLCGPSFIVQPGAGLIP